MRFLLHPVVVKTPRTCKAKANCQALTAVVNQSLGHTKSSSLPSTTSSSTPQTTAWGQQCSSNCGCVLRFEATTCSDTHRILSASYTAKQILTDAQGRVQLTNRLNRPMMKDCDCKPLHYLATAVVDRFLMPTPHTTTWQRVKSELEFRGTRSSLAFAKAVLYSQKLPLHSTGCFDLVEEALTGMFKGYLPKHRQPSKIYYEDEDDDDDEHDEPEYTPAVHMSSSSQKASASATDSSSTLSMHHKSQQPRLLFFANDHLPEHPTMLNFVDEQHVIMMDKYKQSSRQTATKKVPTDWLDYVDRLLLLQEQEAMIRGFDRNHQHQRSA